MRLARALASAALVGCVGDAVIARAAATDAATDAGPVADPSLRIEVTATAEDNPTARADFAASVEIYASRRGVPAEAALTITRDGAPVTVRTSAPGHYVAGLGDYAASAVLALVTADGSRREVPLTAAPVFSFLAPRLHERVLPGAAIPVVWAPSGGAAASLLAPGGPLPVPDTGGLTLPPGTFTNRGGHVIRMQRTTSSAPAGLPSGSTLDVVVVNSVEVEVE